jgi:hypothetical protein
MIPKRTPNSHALLNAPELLLTFVVRRMRKDRGEWGAAMLAELAQLQHPLTRWRFTLGCTRVALFPPRKGIGQTMENHQGNLVNTLRTAAVISSVLVVPLLLLELRFGSQSYSSFPYALFAILWLLPVASVIMIAPFVRSVRAGQSILANPTTLVVRIAFLALFAVLWMLLVRDQLPCFLGVPNCD